MKINKRDKVFFCLGCIILGMVITGCNKREEGLLMEEQLVEEQLTDESTEKQLMEEDSIEMQGGTVTLNKEFFMGIKYGDSFEKLKEKIGEPGSYNGHCEDYPVYELEDGGYANILFYKDRIRMILIYDEDGKMVYSHDKFDIADVLYNEECESSIEDFEQIKWMYSYWDLVMTVGDPTCIVDSGRVNYFYYLKDGTTVNVAFANNGGICRISAYDKNGKCLMDKEN